MIALAARIASAQQTCIEPVELARVEADVAAISAAIDAQEIGDLRARVEGLSDRLPCLLEPIPPTTYARFGRALAVVYFFRQEEDQVVRWARSAEWADPGLPWSPAFGPTHPLRRMIDEGDPTVVRGPTPDGPSLLPPPGGAVLANGRWLDHAEAPVDTPVFVQVFDKKRRRVTAYFQEGPAFQPELLGDPSSLPPLPPDWLGGGEVAGPDPAPKPRGDGPNVPAVATGIGLLAASGVCYALAGQAAGSLPELETSPELTAARTRANVFVLASTLTLVGGVGVTGGGLLLGGRF